MKLSLHRIELPLKRTFTISRESLDVQPSLVVVLEHDGFLGLGEVTENAYYGHTLDAMEAALLSAKPWLSRYVAECPETVWPAANEALNERFALSALDMAAHDLWARRKGQRLFEAWGLAWQDIPRSSYTIGIDSIDTMVAKLQEMPGWDIYKIKLGTPHDLEIVTELRKHTQARFRVDANCAWTVEQTIKNSYEMAELGVEFIEQPLSPNASDADRRKVFTNSALPIIADENCQVTADVDKCHGQFHGVNVKICKCGGLTPAKQMLTHAKQLGLKTMLGCMIESSIGISAAAHLAPLLDYADLDGAVLLREEPATGVRIEQGQIQLAAGPGSGSSWKTDVVTPSPTTL
ncbi:dipeptide epimerase [Bremerella cremea]|uniref:Dipeptide epimerase n=1 Tax=Bremerella cremea TaxID=1031537 RepID=A0A368KX65_9BACT|nr:dipeptide epimerase [Bremerella cremea]RCS54044.1 dipeptide epimerase [Bremerella cremea]